MDQLLAITLQRGYSSFRVHWTGDYILWSEFTHWNHHPSSFSQFHSASLSLKQRASTDTCLLAIVHAYPFLWFICWLMFDPSSPSQFHQALSASTTSVCAFFVKPDKIVKGYWMGIGFEFA